MRIWIILTIFLTLLICVEAFGHEANCIQDGLRVTHFDVTKPKWGIVGAERGMVHGHEMVHPTDPAHNYLQWFSAVEESDNCAIQPRQPEQPTREPEQPTREPEQPIRVPEQPIRVPEQPIRVPEQPIRVPEQPIVEPSPEPPVQNDREAIPPRVIPPREPTKTGDAPKVMPDPSVNVEPPPSMDDDVIEPEQPKPPSMGDDVIEPEQPKPPSMGDDVIDRVVVRTTLPRGITLFHIPCEIEGITRISDVMKMLGDDLFYILSLDAEAQRFDLHLPRLQSINDREFAEYEAFIVVMKRPTHLVLEGNVLTGDIELVEGFNLVEGRVYDEAHIAVSYHDGWVFDALPVVTRGMLIVVHAQ